MNYIFILFFKLVIGSIMLRAIWISIWNFRQPYILKSFQCGSKHYEIRKDKKAIIFRNLRQNCFLLCHAQNLHSILSLLACLITFSIHFFVENRQQWNSWQQIIHLMFSNSFYISQKKDKNRCIFFIPPRTIR